MDATALFVLDSLGVTIGARNAPGIAAMTPALRALEPAGGPATLLTDGSKAGPATAAFLNAAAAHALEFDDTHDEARIHALCAVLPAALAVAEAQGGVSGERFIAAIALGTELFCRLGLSCPEFLDRGWHPTTAFGGISSAAACALLMDLDTEKIGHAMAAAYAQMCGNNQSIADGALTKRAGPGFAARNGVTAAYLAAAGITGPLRFLEGKSGLFALYQGDAAEPEALFRDWGKEWRLLDLSVKPYPCCRCTHGLIELGIDLHRQGIRPEEVAEGVLYLGGVNHKIVHAPFDPKNAADPVVHSQFNARYTFASGLADGRVDLATFDRSRVLSGNGALAERLTCEISPTIAASSLPGASVTLRMRDGTTRTAANDKLLGAPDHPLTRDELLEKFRGALAHGQGASPAEAETLAQVVLDLPRATSLSTMVNALASVIRTPNEKSPTASQAA